MKRIVLLSLASAMAAGLGISSAWAQTNPPRNPNPPQVTPPPANPPQTTTPQANTPQAQNAARQLEGRVVRTDKDQFVVKTRDNREVIVYTNPRTTYRLDGRDVRFSDVRVGSNVRFGYELEGDRYIAGSVVLVPTAATPAPAPGTAVETVPPAQGTVVQGKIMRVIGTDQVVLVTPEGRQVIVYVTPQTTYQVTDQGGVFTDLRPGVEIGVNYDTRDNGFLARRIYRRGR